MQLSYGWLIKNKTHRSTFICVRLFIIKIYIFPILYNQNELTFLEIAVFIPKFLKQNRKFKIFMFYYNRSLTFFWLKFSHV